MKKRWVLFIKESGTFGQGRWRAYDVFPSYRNAKLNERHIRENTGCKTAVRATNAKRAS